MDIEIVRHRTWIHDQTQMYDAVVAHLKDMDPNLAAEVTTRGKCQFAINSHVWRVLDMVGALGLSGTCWFGKGDVAPSSSVVLPSANPSALSDDDDDDGGDGEVTGRELRVEQAAEVMGHMTI